MSKMIVVSSVKLEGRNIVKGVGKQRFVDPVAIWPPIKETRERWKNL